MTDPNIALGFLELRAAVDKGYQLANQKYEEMQTILQKAERRIKLANNEKNQLQGIQTSALISEQNQEIQEMRQSLGDIQKNIETLRERAQEFSIVVYGKKSAGKSTLMEILTQGNGKTIGKGTRRASKDVRTYNWNGFKVTDVSSVDFSFDEVSGALKTADLILFLMTNDAQLAEEAECLAKLKNIGKPILGIVNIRKILNFKNRDSILQELKKILPENKEIENVIADFKKFAPNYNQDWNDIKFMPTHLLAAYFSRMEKVNDEEISNASNFVEVENFILGKIITDGEFWHIKNFIDSVSIPMHNMLQTLFEHSAKSFQESKILLEKSENFLTWRKNFGQTSQRKLSRFFATISEKINEEIPKFADANSHAVNANELWIEQLKKAGHINSCQEFLEELLNECTGELEKLIEVLTRELKNSFGDKTKNAVDFEDKSIFEKYFAIDVPNFFKFLPDTTPANPTRDDAGTLFYQSFFGNQGAVGVSKDALKKQIAEITKKVFEDIDHATRDVLNLKFATNANAFAKLIGRYSYMLVKLGESQREMAESLLGEYDELNSVLFSEAVKSKGAGEISGVKVTLRIPGEILIVIAEKSTVDTEKISELTGEKFSVAKPANSWDETMRTMLGCNFDLEAHSMDSQTDEKTFSVAPYEKVDELEIKLAQQISPYPIINK